jgi:uncharacterized protein with PIN domain
MAFAYFRFYEELNEFLKSERRKRSFRHDFNTHASVKDMIEAFGVPHTEVDLILVNGISVDFSFKVGDGELISVYPVFEAMDITSIQRLRPKPLRDSRFVVDGHLGKLARYLRLLGFDTVYCRESDDDALVRMSTLEHRILLTRDRALLKRKQISHGCYIHSTEPRHQLYALVKRLDLYHTVQPFQRCMRCNGLLKAVDRSGIAHRLKPKTIRYFDEFKICGSCEHIYWKGSHYTRLVSLVEQVTQVPLVS